MENHTPAGSRGARNVRRVACGDRIDPRGQRVLCLTVSDSAFRSDVDLSNTCWLTRPFHVKQHSRANYSTNIPNPPPFLCLKVTGISGSRKIGDHRKSAYASWGLSWGALNPTAALPSLYLFRRGLKPTPYIHESEISLSQWSSVGPATGCDLKKLEQRKRAGTGWKNC